MTIRLFLLDILPQTILQEVSKSSILFNGIQSNACAQSPCKTTALVSPIGRYTPPHTLRLTSEFSLTIACHGHYTQDP